MKKKKARGPKYISSPLNNDMVNYKEYYMSPSEKILYFLATFIVGGLAGLIFYGGLFKVDGEATNMTYISNVIFFVLAGLVAAKFFIPAIRNSLKEKRDRKLKKQFMDMLETLSTSLSAGTTINESFINARDDLLNQYTKNDLIVIEISEIVSGIQNGRTLEEMLANFGERANNDDINNFSNVMANCYRLGGNFKDVVRRTRDIISDKIQISEEIETKLASNKLQLNAMCIMPVILVGMLKISNQNFSANLASLKGVLVTTIAMGMFIGSYFLGQKIINVK